MNSAYKFYIKRRQGEEQDAQKIRSRREFGEREEMK